MDTALRKKMQRREDEKEGNRGGRRDVDKMSSVIVLSDLMMGGFRRVLVDLGGNPMLLPSSPPGVS